MTTHPPGRDWFGVLTWNMHTRGVKVLARHRSSIANELQAGVTVFLLQEVFGQVPDMLQSLGLRAYKAKPPKAPTSPAGAPQTLVAWSPTRWKREWVRTLPLNVTAWGPKGRTPDVIVFLALVALRDLVTGDVVVFGSYHTAPRVQVPERIRPWRRFASLREAARVWRRVAKADRYVILGGDSNVDVDVAVGGPWGFLRRAATGFRIVDPDVGTHDGSRKAIDQFRVKGGVENTPCTVTPVPESDHHRVRCYMRVRR